jgi:hypothetical protein
MDAKVAALFVQPDGCYSELPFVDMWDEQRDARKYPGDLPVIAHPPCQLWGNLAYVNYTRWGGEHNKPGNDNGCFESALDSVRKYGGVLEHPAESRAFWKYLKEPTSSGWQLTIDGDWVCEVWQSAYGHQANKRTWLCYVGDNPPHPMRWDKPVGTHQISRDQRGKEKNKPRLIGKAASATPIEFRDELISLAINSRGERE